MAETVIVISTYPPQGTVYGHRMSAVASYTKNTLEAVSQQEKGKKFVVLADEAPRELSRYRDGNALVLRVWRPNSLRLFGQLLYHVSQYPQVRKVLFAFEWSMLGSFWLIGLVPVLLLILRFMGKQVYFVSHGVLVDAERIAGQLDLKPGVYTRLLTLGAQWFYRLVVWFSYRVVVFEDGLRKGLVGVSGEPDKIVTIPHGVDQPKRQPSWRVARKKLKIPIKDFVVMSFGFLIWYKGSDWLVETMAEYMSRYPKKDVTLLMVGGTSGKHENNPRYLRFLRKIRVQARKHGNKIRITGFVTEEKMPMYFQAADFLVLPYRAFVSSSGPLSLAFSYGKAVLLSNRLRGYFVTKDMRHALKRSGLFAQDILFPLRFDEFVKLLNRTMRGKLVKKKLHAFSGQMRKAREWKAIGRLYANLLD